MKILSIDVGIKNLAFCLFDKSPETNEFKILKWDIVSIAEQESLLCNAIDKNGKCNKPATFQKNDTCYCGKHSKKYFKVPTPEQKCSFINKQKIVKLYEITDKYNIQYDSKSKKLELANLINEYIELHYAKPVATIKAADVSLFNIGSNLNSKFNALFENENKIDYVIIENQISPIATRMKTIQGMIVQYFVMSAVTVSHIEFISASNKLKDLIKPTIPDIENKCIHTKTTYSDRKKLGISKCLGIITTDSRFNEHIDYFNQHKKKDDLSDSFLQGIWFINNKNI